MVELADTPDLESGAERRGGSTPSMRTKIKWKTTGKEIKNFIALSKNNSAMSLAKWVVTIVINVDTQTAYGMLKIVHT